MPIATPSRLKIALAFALLFLLYQSAEGVGDRLLHNSAVQSGLMLLAFLAAWPVGRWLGWRGFDAFGLDAGRGVLPLLGGGLMLGLLAKGAGLALVLATGAGLQEQAPTGPAATSALVFLAGAALTTFVPSVTEDILTRGFLFRTIGVRWRGVTFVVVSAALFTANHIYRFDAGVSEQVRLFCMGLAYAAAAWRWRSLWGAVALHWGYNLANAVWGQFAPVATNEVATGRWITAAIHIALLLIIVLPPRRPLAPLAAPDQMPAYHS